MERGFSPACSAGASDKASAGDTFHLLAVADVDPHGADSNTSVAIDAIACVCIPRFAARLSAPIAVGDGERAVIHHGTLDAGPRAHVDTDLFTHEAAKNNCRCCEDGNSGPCHGGRGQCQELVRQSRRVGKVKDPCAAGCHTDQCPDCPFQQAQGRFARRPLCAVQTYAGVTIPFDPTLHKDKQVGPDRLRAGISAPDAAQCRSEQEQTKPCHDQKTGHKIELVRPNFDPEKIEAPVGQIDQNRLIRQVRPAIPA